MCHGETTTEAQAGAGGDDAAVTINLVLSLGLLFALCRTRSLRTTRVALLTSRPGDRRP
jgi:hypothetical protein